MKFNVAGLSKFILISGWSCLAACAALFFAYGMWLPLSLIFERMWCLLFAKCFAEIAVGLSIASIILCRGRTWLGILLLLCSMPVVYSIDHWAQTREDRRMAESTVVFWQQRIKEITAGKLQYGMSVEQVEAIKGKGILLHPHPELITSNVYYEIEYSNLFLTFMNAHLCGAKEKIEFAQPRQRSNRKPAKDGIHP